MPEKHLHPLQILPLVAKYLFLLLLPVVRGFIAVRSPRALYTWLRGAWFDLLIVLAVALFSYLAWRRSTVCCDKGALILRVGLFVHRESVVPLSHITTLSVEAPWYFLPVRAKRVFIDTEGGRMQQMDFSLLLYSADADALRAVCLPDTAAPVRQYRCKWRYLLFLSIIVSNTLTGALFLATAFNQAGKILGAEFQRLLLTGLESIAGYVVFVPRTAALLALVLLIGWGVAFCRNLLHYVGFSVTRHENILHIRTGALVRREYLCPIDAIRFLDYRQSVLIRLLRLYVVFIHCIGYGKRKYDKAVLLPAVSHTTADRVTRTLLPEFQRCPAAVRPVRGALWRYVRWQACLCLLILLAAPTLTYFFPFWTALIRFGALFSLLPTVWRIVLTVLDRYSAGIGVTDGSYTLRYARGFVLHTVVLPRRCVTCVRLRQSPPQRRRGVCDVYIDSCGERRTVHRVRQLPEKAVRALLKI